MTLKQCPQCGKKAMPDHKLCFDCLILETREETARDIIELTECNDFKQDHEDCTIFELEDAVSDRLAEHEMYLERIRNGRRKVRA